MNARVLWLSLSWLAFTACCSPPAVARPTAPAVAWQSWSAAVFERARHEQRLVLLDLGTQWCHWCHVMEDTTWTDDDVRAVLASSFVAVAEDADRRLDLAARYQDYGWPATIVFDAQGRELWKHRGYVAPERMRSVLRALLAEPSPLADDGADTTAAAATSAGAALAASTRSELVARMDELWDDEHAGYGSVHKYLDLAAAEWLLHRARSGDGIARTRLLRWLDAERALHDRVWGGAWQYSHGGVWTNPHFEKVMARQLADLRAYALAFGAFGRRDDLAAARDVARFLTTMLLAPDGAFYASQDADAVPGQHAGEYFALPDGERRARGLPRIETSCWSRENGQAITGLCALLAVAPDRELQATTLRAAEWIVANRRRSDGTFAHGDHDLGGPFLADSLEMANAFAALGEVTADPHWLDLAVQALHAIDAAFAANAPAHGFATAVGDGVLPPVVDRTENVQLARIAVRVHAWSGDARCRRIAERALRSVTPDAVALAPGLPADLLLAVEEAAAEPMHVVVVGARDDADARELFVAALRAAPAYRVVEWMSPGQASARGESPPPCEGAAAFVCSDGACSAPITDRTQLLARLLGNLAER